MHLHHAAKPNIFHCITERVACSATLSLPLITFPFNVYGYTVCVCVNAALPKIKCMSCTRHAESRRNTFIYIMWLIYHHRRTCTLTTEIDGIDFRAHTEQQEEGEHWTVCTLTSPHMHTIPMAIRMRKRFFRRSKISANAHHPPGNWTMRRT